MIPRFSLLPSSSPDSVALHEKTAHEGKTQNRGEDDWRDEAPDVEGVEGEVFNHIPGGDRCGEIARRGNKRERRECGLPVAGAADVPRQALSHRIHQHEGETGQEACDEEREDAEESVREKKRSEPGPGGGKKCGVNGRAGSGAVEPAPHLDCKEGRKERDAGEQCAGFKGAGSSRERIERCRKAHAGGAGMERERYEENLQKRQPALEKRKMGVRQSGEKLIESRKEILLRLTPENHF